jgi:hypothetical protein
LESPEQSLELPELPEPLEQLEPLEPLVPQSALEPAGQALAAQGPVQQLVLVQLRYDTFAWWILIASRSPH